MKEEKATFAMGCFWKPQQLFDRVKGVTHTVVGYTGGHTKNPTYPQVCGDNTGHAEAIQVTFDPTVVSYKELLELFWEHHNPTTKNRQGPDVGSQYRSVVFYHTAQQKKEAEEAKKELESSGRWEGKEIVTELVPLTEFYQAEEYHQKYVEKQGGKRFFGLV